jgi:hypothetical protein
MLLPALLALLALMIIVAALAWGWRHETLRTTEQEWTDIEFERIIRRLDTPTS